MPRPVRSILPALLAALLLAPGAQAATVTLNTETAEPALGGCGPGNCPPPFRPWDTTVRITAAPGERNVATAAAAADHVFTVTDTAGLQAGSGCVQRTPTVATCSAQPAPVEDGVTVNYRWAVEAALGDGDDAFTVESAPETLITARGQDGADAIALRGTNRASVAIGGGADDTLTASDVRGGDGDDDLRITGTSRGIAGLATGGQGEDVIIGSDQSDTINPGIDFDRVDARDGADDFVEYDDLAVPVLVDLRGSPAPEPGVDADLIVRAEHATGGSGDDTLLGDGRRNILAGGSGTDTIRAAGGDDIADLGGGGGIAYGGAGDDLLRGGPGDQALNGGAGNDEIEFNGGGEDYAFGGPGDDVFRSPSARSHPFCDGGDDLVDTLLGRADVAPDCERLSPFGLGAIALPRLSAKGVHVQLGDLCPLEDEACRVRLRLLGVGGVRAVVARGETVRRVLRLGAAQRRRLSQGFATFAVQARSGIDDRQRRTFRVRLG